MIWNNVFTDNPTVFIISDLNCVNLEIRTQISGIFNVNISGNLTHVTNVGVGTSTLVLVGTGTWSGVTGFIQQNVTINTSGTITLGSAIFLIGKTFTYITGTVVTAGNTFKYQSMIIKSNGIIWNNLEQFGYTITLTSNLTCTGNYVINSNYTSAFVNGLFNVIIGGNLTQNNSFLGGTSNIILNGTGTWSNLGTAATDLRNNLTINTAGTLTISGTISYSIGTIAYTAGVVNTTNSTLSIGGSCTLNTSGMNWNNITFSVDGTVTLTSNINVLGNVNFASNTSITLNGFIMYCSGSFDYGVTLSTYGSTSIVLNGTGTLQSGRSDVDHALSIQINTTGTITIGNLSFGGVLCSFIRTSGTVIVIPKTTLTFRGYAGLNFNSNGILWENLSFSVSLITLQSDIICLRDVTGGANIVNNTAYTIYIGGGFYTADYFDCAATVVMNGTGTLELLSRGFNGTLNINTNGTIAIKTLFLGRTYVGTTKFNYIKGRIITTKTSALIIDIATTFTGVNNIPFGSVTVNAAFTCDAYFSGTPNIITNVIGNNNTVTFTSTKSENFSKFIKLTNVNTLPTQRGRLVVTTINANQGGNTGVIFGNGIPDGFPGNTDKLQEDCSGFVEDNFGRFVVL